MPQFGWPTCPLPVRRQVLALADGLSTALGSELLGVYLHGSLALGCFNPQRSDLDLLAVTAGPLPAEARTAVARRLLQVSGVPSPVELSVLSYARLHPWQHPTPYEFHYSEDWRARTAAHLAASDWPEATATPTPTDPDLAAHLTVTLARGVCLWGQPAAALLPPVPPHDYLNSILQDFRWGRERLRLNPVYFILNACRVRAYVEAGLTLSKDEGGAWALSHLPHHHAVVRQALQLYRGELVTETWDYAALEAFAATMARAVPGTT